MFNPRAGGRRMPGLALGLLVTQMAQVGFDRIPPVTFVTITGQVVLYYQLLAAYWSPAISEVCVSSLRVWYQDDYLRLILASFFHLDEWHLYYNMSSLLWKGVKLERRLGSAYFLCLLASFSVLCNAVLVGLGILVDQVLHDSSYVTQCAAGFSGVLFALKVVLTYTSPPGVEYVMGLVPVPNKFVCWAELVLIHILIPNSSFIGHLSGILVGLLYVMGPLRWVLDALFAMFQVFGAHPRYSQEQSGYDPQGQTVGRGSGTRAFPPDMRNINQSQGDDGGGGAWYRAGSSQDQGRSGVSGYSAQRSEPQRRDPPSVAAASSERIVDQDLLRMRRLNRFEQ